MPCADKPSNWCDEKGYYPHTQDDYRYLGCCICGSKHQIGFEPRFGYPICEKHSSLSPVEVSEQRKDL